MSTRQASMWKTKYSAYFVSISCILVRFIYTEGVGKFLLNMESERRGNRSLHHYIKPCDDSTPVFMVSDVQIRVCYVHVEYVI